MKEHKAEGAPAGRAGFEVVTVASARARQLLRGCVPKVDGSAKLARRALQEVSAGRVTRARKTDGE